MLAVEGTLKPNVEPGLHSSDIAALGLRSLGLGFSVSVEELFQEGASVQIYNSFTRMFTACW